MGKLLYIVTTQQMQAAEKAADTAGLSYEQLMENAGRGVAQAIAANFTLAGQVVLVLVGPGNNGGDGLVVARHLAQWGALVTVYIWKRQVESDKNWTLLEATSVAKIFAADDPEQTQLSQLLGQTNLLVDALLGTGVSRPIAGSLAELLTQVKTVVTARRAGRPGSLTEPVRPTPIKPDLPAIVAVDLPSGLNSDTGEVDPYTLPADMTVTFGAVKFGHILRSGPAVVGRLLVDDIGMTPDHFPKEVSLEMVTADQVASILPARPLDANKGTFGRALIVAGSKYYTGAVVLAGQAALRSGPGLVTVAAPQSIYPLLTAHIVEATYLPLPDQEGAFTPAAVSELQEMIAVSNALLVGPGLGQAGQVYQFLLALLKEVKALHPLILDADALNILAQQPEWWRLLPPHCILTPHPGEMSRLTGRSVKEIQANRLEVAQSMAAKWNQIVLLKGAHTIIAAPKGRTVVQPFANPALAKGGSGDVLAGIMVGLLAQGVSPFEAATAAAYLHGLSGEVARDTLGATAALAGDLVRVLPEVIQSVTTIRK